MKKNMIALAVATAFAAPAVMADATLYGQANLTAQKLSGDVAGEELSVTSNASRFGIKGSNDLGDGLKAVYQMEFQVDMDSKSEGGIANRNQFVGIAGGFGTVMLGNMDTPLKSLEGKTSLFEDTAADMSASITTSASGANFSGEVRSEQSLTYVSPKFEGVQVALQTSGLNGTRTDNESSVSVVYTGMKDLMVGVAQTNNHKNVKDDKVTLLAATYKMDNMKFGLGYETTEMSDDKKSVVLVHGAYTMDKVTFAAQVQKDVKDDIAVDNEGDTKATVAAMYGFNKSTSAWLALTQQTADSGDTDEEGKGVQVGFITKF